MRDSYNTDIHYIVFQTIMHPEWVANDLWDSKNSKGLSLKAPPAPGRRGWAALRL